MFNRTQFSDEVQLDEDECCIVFDFGCYFPYKNVDDLVFGFSLGLEEFDDYKINHRYPNRLYETISRKYGRKVSKIGYPYIMKIEDQSPMILRVRVGLGKEKVDYLFVLKTTMTRDKPICELSLRYKFQRDEHLFLFFSQGRDESGAITRRIWRNFELEPDRDTVSSIMIFHPRIEAAGKSDNYLMLPYDGVIEPFLLSISDF